MDEPALLPLEKPKKYGKKRMAIPNFEYLRERHPKRDFQSTYCMYNEYVQACERVGRDPYSWDCFKKNEMKWRKNRVRNWNPGEVFYCEVKDLSIKQERNESGGIRCLFIAVSPYSEYSYACVVDGSSSRPRGDLWMRCCIQAYRYFGGVCRATFCPCFKETLNDKARSMYCTLHAFAAHYGTVLFYPRESEEGSGWQEPLAERHRWGIVSFINKRLKSLPWLSAEDLNRKIYELLEEYNEGVNVRGNVRREDFDNNEAPELLPLPAQDYDMSIWQEKRVRNDYHFEHRGFRYSVPFRYIWKTVLVRSSEDALEVYHGGELIARHRLADASDGRRLITDPSHRPGSHKARADRLRNYFIIRAREIGPNTAAVMKELLSICETNDGSHRPCKDLLDLRNTPSELTLEEACKVVLEEGAEKTVSAVIHAMNSMGR